MQVDNPFIRTFLREINRLPNRFDKHWSFHYVSSNFSCDDDGRVTSGVKLNCKVVPSLYCIVRENEWGMVKNLILIKDIAISESETRKGHFKQFINYLLGFYDAIYLESVQPEWANLYLSGRPTVWIRQSGNLVTNNYLLVKERRLC